MGDELERIAILETKVDSLIISVDNMPNKIVSMLDDKMTIKVMECAASREGRFLGIKMTHITAGSIAGVFLALFKVGEWLLSGGPK